nr:EF-hand domain-containing family member B isoform X2 [Macaca nemestrina]
MAVVVAAAAPSALRVAPLTLDCAGLLPWCRPCRAPSPPLAAPPSSFLSPPPPPPPALEFRRSLPPPPPSASSPKASRRLLHEPKHKHSSPTAGATSAVRCLPRRHVAARSELRPFVTSCHRQCPRSIRFPAPSRIPPRPGLFAGRGEARCHVTLRVALTGAGRLSPLPPPQAGKVIPVGYRVASCVTEKLPRLITPPASKKYFNFRYPPAGVERVFYGRANDPQIAPYLTHGIRSKISIPANTLINPQPITTFQQKIKDKKESIYLSNRRAPLGKSHDQAPGLPKGMDTINTTFGTAIIREYSAKDVVNPPKSYEEVFKEGNEGHDLYVVSHNDYYAGEAKNRKYNPSSFHRFNVYGVPTPHFNDGRAMAKSLYWLHELQMKRGAKFVSKRADDFKEKFQHKLGRVLDPIAETMNVPPDYTFGACLRPEEYGVGDLIHNRLPGEYLRGKDRQRALIAAVRHHLKKVNYQKFDTLLAAFRHYDKKGDGMIDKAELQEACDQANLSLDDKLLDQLFDYCDVDNDGFINYLEFANFLNWKDKMLLKEYEERVIIKGRKPDCVNPTEANVEEPEPALLIKPEDIVLKEPGSTEKTLRTLLRPSDKVSNYYKTTSSEINAVVGAVPATCYPICGVPTIRSDIPAPRIRRISDRSNYGEEGGAYSLLYPTVFAQKGVFERDFFKTRSKEEIAEILCNIGVKLSDEEFENVWNLASKKHHRGEVCVENIRNVLDELRHADRIKCKTSM